jgi:hypothetical protein
MRNWWHHRAIDRYFEGRLDTEGEVLMRARLERCAACRAHYDRHLVVEAALSGGGSGATDRLWRSVQRAAPVAPVRAGRRASTPRLVLGGAVLGVAAILLVAIPRLGSSPTRAPVASDPVPRGSADAARAPTLHVFRSVSAHAAEPLADGASIRARDGLLFAYSSSDPALTHLMIFGIDAAYGVHWYYPAFLRAGDNPEAVPIVAGGLGIELGEEIRHDLPPGPLRIVALFLREPRRVAEVEALVRANVAEPRRTLDAPVSLPVPGSVEPSVMLRVVP